MEKSKFKHPDIVLVFNQNRVLISLVCSLRYAAKMIEGKAQSVSLACKSDYITTRGWYFRKMHPNYEFKTSDLYTLELEEYDRMCKNKKARYHPKPDKTRRAKRKRNYKPTNKNNYE